MVRAFVTGGSGFVGANLVAGLNDHGIEVKVLMRESSSTKALEGLEYHRVSGDILDPVETLHRAGLVDDGARSVNGLALEGVTGGGGENQQRHPQQDAPDGSSPPLASRHARFRDLHA